MEVRGWLTDYYEQGMEGYSVWGVQDEQFGWDIKGLVPLKRGDWLRILRDDGSIVWEGEVKPRKLLGIWDQGGPPAGVEEADWEGWLIIGMTTSDSTR